MAYIDDHKASGLKVGDTVKVLMPVPGRTNGWAQEWISVMDSAVGKTGEIVDDRNSHGFQVEIPNNGGSGYLYPCYSLMLVNQSTESADNHIITDEEKAFLEKMRPYIDKCIDLKLDIAWSGVLVYGYERGVLCFGSADPNRVGQWDVFCREKGFEIAIYSDKPSVFDSLKNSTYLREAPYRGSTPTKICGFLKDHPYYKTAVTSPVIENKSKPTEGDKLMEFFFPKESSVKKADSAFEWL